MKNIIHRLSDAVANQIAAGEVIQRPASVVKELMENAVDAGACSIDVAVNDAGRSLIRVADDGRGMSPDDARLAFEKHATSKITGIEDLFSLRTMGFRGEALPSIASVAQVTLQTRTVDDEVGVRLDIEGGKFTSEEPCVCKTGTCFEVKNLFFNIPARRKFLKSNHTELSNIMQEFERVALVNNSVNFSLTSDGTVVNSLLSTNRKKRIADLFGKKMCDDLLDVVADTSMVKIAGFVGRPESAHKKNVRQFFFVNGRFMRHAYFNKAVQVAFEGLIPADEQVPYFLFLDTDPANVDVNISPTKTEVKFENEPALWQIIVASVREALGRFNAAPTIEFEEAPNVEIPVFEEQGRGNTEYRPEVSVDRSYNPFKTGSYESYRPTKVSEEVFDLFDEAKTDVVERGMRQFQYKGRYILTASGSGLMIIDQRRAHIRVLYEKFMSEMEAKPAVIQGSLFPEKLELPASDAMIMNNMLEDVCHLGFDVVSLGGGTFSINGTPDGVSMSEAQRFLVDMVESVRDGNCVDAEYRHNMALSMARSSAIVVGQVMSEEEMDRLVNDLFMTKNPNLTPDGKKIIEVVSDDRLEEIFNN